MRYELLYESDYIRMVDLKGKDVTLTIEKAQLDNLQLKGTSKKQRRGVLYFKEVEKRMVLNRANGDTIAKLYGVEVESWFGKRITLYPDPTIKFGTETVGGIRVRSKVPPAKASPPPHDKSTGDGPPPDAPAAA